MSCPCHYFGRIFIENSQFDRSGLMRGRSLSLSIKTIVELYSRVNFVEHLQPNFAAISCHRSIVIFLVNYLYLLVLIIVHNPEYSRISLGNILIIQHFAILAKIE